ncbi:MAG: iron-containing alcohol dehydrogenase [Phycisphaerales bacterium]|nr:iron-containing alcohol dehydrogenase [Phycisphaerales bacterium]
MSGLERIISFSQPRILAFGPGCAPQVAGDLPASTGSAFIITSPPVAGLCTPIVAELQKRADRVTLWDGITTEPAIADFEAALSAARNARADAIIGIGGGSVLDVAKLVAAFLGNEQDITDAFGIGRLSGRWTHLACLPTTAGTGSEVSPNAILLDERERIKKGVISPHLVPDAAYVDPLLTLSVPPAITGATGIDALTHCIEAYANKLAHPIVDQWTWQGARRIAASLQRACEDGSNLAARTDVALGSLFGGLALGPVNTGAVHALSYPLGGEFHVPHGVANAVLLCPVLEFNLPAAPDRYAQLAIAMNQPQGADDLETARNGLTFLRKLCAAVGIPGRLRDLGVPENALERLARSAMTVTRLLDRNVRTVTLQDAIDIYRKAF